MPKGDGSQLERELASLPRAGGGREAVVPNPKAKLMDQVREVMRLRHYSIRTERSYCDWIRRYIHFHHMLSRADLDGAEAKIEAFLSDLAVKGNVAVSTQNQAFNALLFLYASIRTLPPTGAGSMSFRPAICLPNLAPESGAAITWTKVPSTKPLSSRYSESGSPSGPAVTPSGIPSPQQRFALGPTSGPS